MGCKLYLSILTYHTTNKKPHTLVQDMGLRYDFRSILTPNDDFFGIGFTYDGDTNICGSGNSSIFDGNLKNNSEERQALRNVSLREKTIKRETGRADPSGNWVGCYSSFNCG